MKGEKGEPRFEDRGILTGEAWFAGGNCWARGGGMGTTAGVLRFCGRNSSWCVLYVNIVVSDMDVELRCDLWDRTARSFAAHARCSMALSRIESMVRLAVDQEDGELCDIHVMPFGTDPSWPEIGYIDFFPFSPLECAQISSSTTRTR